MGEEELRVRSILTIRMCSEEAKGRRRLVVRGKAQELGAGKMCNI